jgi:hypothetical protein
VRIKTTKGLFLILLAFAGVFGWTTHAYGNGCHLSLRAMIKTLRHSPDFNNRARDYANAYKFVSDLRAEGEIPVFFQRFDALTPEQQLTFATEFLKLDEGQRIGAISRIGILSRAGDSQKIDRMIKVISARSQTFGDLTSSPLGGSTYEADALKASQAFAANPTEALDHIWRGAIRINVADANRPVIAFGVHSMGAFQDFLNQRARHHGTQVDGGTEMLDRLAVDYQKALDEPIPPGPPDWAVQAHQQDLEDAKFFGPEYVRITDQMGQKQLADMPPQYNGVQASAANWRSMGFEINGRNLIPFMIMHDEYVGLSAAHNGVVRARLPRGSYRGQAWDQSKVAAENGLVPLGGKTLFPKSWTEQDVSTAIANILKDPKSVILDSKKIGSNKMFYVVGTHNGVRMAIGIIHGEVKTAFPTWRQVPPDSVGDGLAEYAEARDRFRTVLWRLNSSGKFSRRITEEDLREMYLKKTPQPAGLRDSEFELLRSLASPGAWVTRPDAGFCARANLPDSAFVQHAVTALLQAERLLNDLDI